MIKSAFNRDLLVDKYIGQNDPNIARTTKGMPMHPLLIYDNKLSISLSFSSKTLQASSIGVELVISTPAFFNTSIG